MCAVDVFLADGVDNRRGIFRGRQEIDNSIEQALNALVSECGAAIHGNDFTGYCCFSDNGDYFFCGKVACLEEFFQQ